MSRYQLPLVTCLAATLAGCSSGWHKPGSSEAEFNQTRSMCEARSSAAFPPAMVTHQGGFTTPTQTSCRTVYPGQVQCSTTPGTTMYQFQTDQNALQRQANFQDCMKGAGYVWKTGN